jgi:hypothetical protein
MAGQLSRRQVLKLGLLSTMVVACAPAAPGARGARAASQLSLEQRRCPLCLHQPPRASYGNMVQAARIFLRIGRRVAREGYSRFDDSERVCWH